MDPNAGDDPLDAAFKELAAFATPLANTEVDLPIADVEKLLISLAPGTVAHLGGDIPTRGPQDVGPTPNLALFKLNTLNPQGIKNDTILTTRPAGRDRLFNPTLKDEATPAFDTSSKYQHFGKRICPPFSLYPDDIGVDKVSPLSDSMRANTSKLYNLQEEKRAKEQKDAVARAARERKAALKEQSNQEDPDDDAKGTHKHMDYEKAPLSNIYQIFDKIADRAMELSSDGNLDDFGASGQSPLEAACDLLGSSGVRIFTMCSGTEAPVLAMDLLKEAFGRKGLCFNYDHLASAEIEPFKQGYIELNFHPRNLFRDVTEFNRKTATTAYGAKVAVPNKCHIVVAGSACVDYSSLNAHIKTFGQQGESYATMMGVLNYCENNRPAMVILENIKGAPWDRILETWHDSGYDVIAVGVDTKNFQIPQTRQRGYMLGINRSLANEVGFDTKKALDLWVLFFGQLQQRATSPYTSFIYANDSSENEKVRYMVDSTAEVSNKEITWALCAQRYMLFRSTGKFGTGRPYTFWRENGTCRPPEFSWHWLRVQRDRVLDTLDIAYLRYIVDRDYDMSAKSRTVDLSQNIDRDLDSKHFGIVGCLTSTGLLYDTYRGGVVSGIEALILQGIPVDDLILDKLTMKHMIDLAGNAMSSTVVGSAMLAAIAAGVQGGVSMFSPYLPQDNPSPTQHGSVNAPLNAEQVTKMFTDADLHFQQQSIAPHRELCLEDHKQDAYNTRQLCVCEGVTGKKETQFVRCQDCDHTACIKCGINPEHSYQHLDVSATTRDNPLEFINGIQQSLPRSMILYDDKIFEDIDKQYATMHAFREPTIDPPPVDLSESSKDIFHGRGTLADTLHKGSASILGSQKLDELNIEYRTLLLAAFKEPLHYRGVKRDTVWKIEYTSANAKLVLCFDTNIKASSDAATGPLGVDCLWILTVLCPPELPQGSLLREKLQHPVARMYPKDNLLSGAWEFWKFDAHHDATVTVSQIGQLLPAMESRSGITNPDFASLQVSEQLQLSFDRTLDPLPSTCDFVYLPKCGTPCSILYRSKDKVLSPGSTTARYVFMFLDPGHLQDAIYDSMVIAFGHERLPRTETRLTLVKFASSWRPISDSRNEKKGLYRSRVSCQQTGSWIAQLSTRLIATMSTISVWLPQFSDKKFASEGFCDDDLASVPVYAVYLPFVPEMTDSFGSEPKKFTIDLADKRGKMKQLKFILGALQIPSVLAQEHQIYDMTSLSDLCESCSPTPPALTWKWMRKRKSAKLHLRPVDDPDKSREYEKALKTRSMLASAVLYLTQDGAYFELSINVQTLLHRTVAPMLRSGGDFSSLKVSWRVIKYDALKTPIPYKILSLQGTENYKPCQKPPRFSRNLWDSQARTLCWMTEIETGNTIWTEHAVQENPIEPLEWNLIAHAARDVTVKGGILADGVGTGKTTVILALTGLSPGSTPEDPKNSSPTRKESRATLILVPANLMEQWKEQIIHCYSKQFLDTNVVVIDGFSDLLKLGFDELAQAKIILVSLATFEETRYWEDLRDMCYAPNVPTSSGRAYIQWLQAAMRSLDELSEASTQFSNAEDLQNCRNALHNQMNNKEFANLSGFRKRDMAHINPDTLKAPEIQLDHERERQQAYPEAVESTDAANFDCDWNDLKPAPCNSKGRLLALLHMFGFTRIVVDEFQYLSPKTYAAVLMLRSEKTWLLSGTPPIDDVDSVDAMARLLGTRITMRPDEFVCQGFALEKAKAMLKERSYVEEFQAFNDVESVARTEMHREQARTFLGQFARSNTVTTADLQLEEHVVAVLPQAVERVVFMQYYSTLNNEAIKYSEKDLPFKKLDALKDELKSKPGSADPDTGDAIVRSLQQSRNAEMAMICCYAMTALKLDHRDKQKTVEGLYDGLNQEFGSYVAFLFKRISEAVGYWFEGGALPQMQKENSDLTDWIREILENGSLGDQDLTLLLDQMLGYAQENHESPEELLVEIMIKKPAGKMAGKGKGREPAPKWRRDDMSLKTRNKEMQVRTADLRETTKKALKTLRHVRLMYQLGRIGNGAEIFCAACGRGSGGTGRFPDDAESSDALLADGVLSLPLFEKFSLLGTCGHVFCNDCIEEDTNTTGVCLAAGCGLVKEPHNTYAAANFQLDRTAAASEVGSRASAVIKQVQQILGGRACKPLDTDDYVVVFVQFFAQAKELAFGFESAGIALADACVDPGMGPAAAKQRRLEAVRATIQNFKTEAMKGNREADMGFCKDLAKGDTTARKRANEHVLMLMVDSEDAAGWNLQVCNHVVLAAPYVAPTLFRYTSVLKQAVGRALRVGQEKVVHVYQFGMAYTCEINLLEGRMAAVGGGGKQVVIKDGMGGWAWAEEATAAVEDRVSGPPLLVGSGAGDEPEEEAE